MKRTSCAFLIMLVAGCVDEPSLGEHSAELDTGPRPRPLFTPDILWENGPSITYHSYIPPSRTTHDGRITFESQSFANFMGRCFRLIRPEVLSGHLSTTAQELGAALNERYCLGQEQFHNTTFAFGTKELGIQGALCDATPNQPQGRVDPRATNAQPQPCPSDATRDCYTVTTFTHMMTPDGVAEEVWSRPFRIEVSSPKTAAARIESVTPLATAVSVLQHNVTIIEPVVSGDGCVLVYHDGRDTKYSVNPDGDAYGPCDARGFSAPMPVSSMHTDSRMTPFYGLAKSQLRDSEGNYVAAGAEVGGAYPWIDRDVNNLFLTTAGSSLYYQHADTNQILPKFTVLSVPSPDPASPNPPTSAADIEKIGSIGGRSGITVMGLWTQGKMVVLDSRNNNSDLAILENCTSNPDFTANCALPPIHDRVLDLYVGGGTRIGASNSFFINSPENVLNYDADLRPLTPRDVVWQLASTTGTDEVAFDDYLMPRALVISPMNAPVANTHPNLHERNYIDGFEHTPGQFRGRGFTRDPHVQNAAASKHWTPPSYGLLQGGARIEPVAAGGVKGKGLWLDGINDRITYNVPAQTQSADMTSSAWMYSLWLNPTTALGATQLKLLTTPDGTELRISSTQLVAQRGAITSTTALPAALVPATNRFTHLAVVSTPSALSVYVDGYLLQTQATSGSLLRMSAGNLVVGSATGNGFVGWIDELKVIARAPNPEEMCNHAYGTLVGVSSGMPGYTKALNYPTSSHNAINAGYSHYTCESQVIAGAGSGGYLCKFSRSDARCVGRQVLVPQGRLEHGVPRPVTSSNTFCTSCHVASAPTNTLRPEALDLRTTAHEDDRRRQPMQPEPLLFGRIPAGLLGPGVPASTFTAPAAGYEIDPVTLPGGTLCVPSATTLCLMNRRFAVTLTFVHNGQTLSGQAIPHTPNTGHFWFFQNTNIEVTVKALDGQGVNNRAWVFHSGITSLPYTVTVYDHFNKTSKVYPSNAVSGDIVCGVQDTSAFLFNASMGAIDGVSPGAPLGPPPAGSGSCVPGPTRLCALGRRYEVTVRYRNASNVMVPASVRGEQTDQSGFFTFFDANNLELLVKVIDGTAVNGKIWLFYGSLTGVVYDITLRDTVAPRQVTFTSTTGAQGQQCGRLSTSAL